MIRKVQQFCSDRTLYYKDGLDLMEIIIKEQKQKELNFLKAVKIDIKNIRSNLLDLRIEHLQEELESEK